MTILKTLTLPPLPTAQPQSRNQRVIPNEPKWFQVTVAWSIFAVERFVSASLRYRWVDDSGLSELQSGKPVIFCLWHNRLSISMSVHRKFPRKLVAMVSASKDGALLTAVLKRFGVENVRGSTSRRGPQALLELAKRAKSGYDLSVTPDGPRGPRYVVQKGVIALAQVTGLGIIPVTCNIERKFCLNGWDHFQIPLPFSKCEIILKKPIFVPRVASELEREELRLELQRSLLSSSKD